MVRHHIETCPTSAISHQLLRRKRTDGGGGCGMGSGRGREEMQVPGLACAGPLGHATSCDPAASLAAEVAGGREVPVERDSVLLAPPAGFYMPSESWGSFTFVAGKVNSHWAPAAGSSLKSHGA